jgi:hypothetical protein
MGITSEARTAYPSETPEFTFFYFILFYLFGGRGRVAQFLVVCEEEFENTKGVMKICNSNKVRRHNGQKKRDKQRDTKHYREN